MGPFPSFTFRLAPGERLDVFLKQSSDFSTVRLDYEVMERKPAFLFSLEHVSRGIFLATFILSLLLTSLMFTLTERTKLFVLYSCFLLASLPFVLIQQGFGAYFSWLDSQNLNYLFLTGVAVYVFFSLMLSELFRDIDSPWIPFITVGLNFAVCAASLAAALVDNSTGFNMFANWGGGIIINGALTVVILIALQKKHPSAPLAALGWAGFLTGGVLTTQYIRGNVGDEFAHSLGFGIIFEGLIFTLVVASRIRREGDATKREAEENIKRERTNQLALIGELTATMTHEIKQPVHAMSLIIANLKAVVQKSPEKALEMLPDKLLKLEGLVNRTAQLSDQVRKSSRLSVNNADGASIKKSLEECRLILGPDLDHLQIKLKVEIDPNLPNVALEPLRFDQVLTNIIGNAKDAIQSSAPEERWIQIKAKRIKYRQVEITIEDSAGGIPANVLHVIFDKYFTTKNAELGTGLGLSVCREIVESDGGVIQAENTAHGACFTLTLPTVAPESA
jgi:signal transduction histidine kinase